MSTTTRDFVGNELHPGDVIAIPIRHPVSGCWLEAWRIMRLENGLADLNREADDRLHTRTFSNFSDCVKICVPDGSQP